MIKNEKKKSCFFTKQKVIKLNNAICPQYVATKYYRFFSVLEILQEISVSGHAMVLAVS